VNRGTVCPSPVPVVLPRAAPQVLRAAGPADRAPAFQTQTTVLETAAAAVCTRRRLDCELKSAEEEVVEAMAAKRFSVLEDQEAVRHRASDPEGSAAAPVAVGMLCLAHLLPERLSIATSLRQYDS
jgi:hypothetical protein